MHPLGEGPVTTTEPSPYLFRGSRFYLRRDFRLVPLFSQSTSATTLSVRRIISMMISFVLFIGHLSLFAKRPAPIKKELAVFGFDLVVPIIASADRRDTGRAPFRPSRCPSMTAGVLLGRLPHHP